MKIREKLKHRPEMVKILEISDESPTTKTFTLDKRIDAKPGQFCMLWIPGVDEKPFSFSAVEGNLKITVKTVGPFTEKMHDLLQGDLIGFRGPYGNPFTPAGKEVCVIAGGCGSAPLLPLAKILKAKDITIVIGASTKTELLFMNEFEKLGETIPVTEDDSYGRKGMVTDILGEILLLKKFDQMYTCGPEPMLNEIANVAKSHNIPCQISLERYMKCGFGLCGSCCIDDLRVCEDGPVFDIELLKGTEFGKFKRDGSGSRCEF